MAGTLSKVFVAVVIAAAPVLAQPGPQIVFEREVIRVFITAGKIRVEGFYVFRNPLQNPGVQNLFYPFPVDSLHPFPGMIEVRSKGEAIPYRAAGAGVAFPVRVPGRESVMVRVIYEQACLDSSGCYILKSTAEWETPLKEADFEVQVPDGVELTWMAYEADTVEENDGALVYRFSRETFMPEKDLCLRWRVRNTN